MTMIEAFFVKAGLAFQSKTVWTIASFLAVQLPAIKNNLSPALQGVVDVALAFLAVYFRMNPNPTLSAAIKQVNDTPRV